MSREYTACIYNLTRKVIVAQAFTEDQVARDWLARSMREIAYAYEGVLYEATPGEYVGGSKVVERLQWRGRRLVPVVR